MCGAGAVKSMAPLRSQTTQLALTQQSRQLSTLPPSNGNSDANKGALQQFDYDDYDDYEEPTTAGKSTTHAYSIRAGFSAL